MEVEITYNNVQELWGLYETYKREYRRHCFTFREALQMEDFETFVENEVTQCSQCREYVLTDDIGDSELALQDNICKNCMEEGYGE